MSIWHNFSFHHYAALALIVVLAYSASQRLRSASRNRELFWANVIVPITLLTSLPPVYYWLDTLLGNLNLVNLMAHIGVVVAGWLASRALGKTGAAFQGEKFNTRWFSPIWPFLMVLTLIFSFVQIGLGYSSRGLDTRASDFLYGIYHGVTYLGFSFAAPYVLPRLKQLIKAAYTRRRKVQFSLFYIGYLTTFVAVLLHFISPWESQVQGPREFFIYTTGFLVTTAFVMVTFDKKPLAQPQVQTGNNDAA